MIESDSVSGIKTGVTVNAGPCLATYITLENRPLIIVLLNSKNMDIRWPETWKLAKWAAQRLKRIRKF